MTSKPILTLYTRVGCHLCDEMKQELELFQEHYAFSFNIVDVDVDPSLKQQYGDRVPVLVDGSDEICHYFLNKDVLLEKVNVS